MATTPMPPPEAATLRSARIRQHLSVREAAQRAGVSASLWRQVEAGYMTPAKGVHTPKIAPAATLARMAQAVDLQAEHLESRGQRPDAAEILREMERQAPAVTIPRTAPPPASVDDSDDDIADVRLLLEGIDKLQIPIRPEFDRIMGIVRQFPPGVIIPGIVLFDDDRYIKSWDDKIGSTYADGQIVTPARAAVSVALEQVKEQREAEQRGDAAAGLRAGSARLVRRHTRAGQLVHG